jgi:hypothetical protein
VEPGDKDTRGAAASGVALTAQSLARIEAVVDGGGQIMLGTMRPVDGAAVAHDGKKTLAMLRRRPTESVAQLLLRLDEAIGQAQTTGQRVDEINAKPSDQTYEVANPALGRRANAARR